MFDRVLGRPFRGPGVWPPAAAAVLLGLLLAISGPAVAQQEPPAVTVAKPVVREIVEDDEFVGRFQAVDEVAIRSRVSGYLDQVHFRDGALVSKGQLLFTIDRRPYQTTYDAARSQVDVASSVLDFTKAQFERADELAKSGNLSISTLDDRRREYLSAQAAFQGATAALQSSKLNLEFTEIKAPLSGRIDRRLVSVGNLVQSDSTLLTTIVATDPIDFYFDIDERIYLAYARDARERGGVLQDGGSRLEVKVRIADRGETSFDGTLDFAENRIDSATGTLRTRARFANPDGILQPGMFGRINVPGSLPYKGVLIPDEALGSDQDRRIVLVVDDAGAVSAKPVRIGPRIDGYRVIREGLTGDETIIINGLMRVRPGITVKPELVVLPPVAETAGSK
ncbi:MAG: efflux RND transporter periplasmic adaptor subunit [Alphaproteobacteria bacterium]|nr:efflux RND transporter periplasmic adaptor subunit [Alphaproteobacteria bacterium]MBU0805068.1 efflux RND transporter periplasmic adaptor subunit [Alphaproteobacteria bacterium]MBU0870567.1 efflux RND transporter periplasmic adaptor subunit [Alphaproteobacteria bacterium]MBU1401758.1 efflux RND transporter periplasmic adaptor subunit [Alphaproteobacteria bacterium]MBU1591825.1 efflux RND transporter periplasmic adaptor subunit [Alphaproteobacteria bacterium]